MPLIDRVAGIHFEISFFDDEKHLNELFDIAENLKLGVLKNMMFDIEFDELIYQFTKKVPVLTLISSKYDFSIEIRKKGIVIDYPSRISRKILLDELEKDEKELFNKENLVRIDTALTSLVSAISTELKKPIKYNNTLLGIMIKQNKEEINSLLSKIVSINVETKAQIEVDRINLKVIDSDTNCSYVFRLFDELIIVDKEIKGDLDISISQLFQELIDEIELFIEERKINV